MYNDWDFSPTGRERQAFRMRSIADSCVETYKIADFVAPTKELRAIYNADFSVWMNTIAEGRFEDTNKAWRIPTENEYDVIIDTFIPPEEEAKRLCHLILEAQQG
jgi:adenylylsulfate kinase